MLINPLGYVRIWNSDPSSILEVGNVYAQGTIESTEGVFSGSDLRLKKNIKTIDNSLDRINQLRGVTYKWKESNLWTGMQIGLIVQEVEEVFPEVVTTNSEGYKSLEYGKLVSPLIEAVKALKEENDNLKDALANLSARVSALESTQ